jgi:mRNA turnover protein 4
MRGVDKMPHNMEQHIRSLGMPTTLQNGIVMLSSPYDICRLGQTLTTNQAHLLVSTITLCFLGWRTYEV